MASPVTVQQMLDDMYLLGDYLVSDGDYSGDSPRAPASGTLIRWLDKANKRTWNWYTDTDEDYALTRTILTTVQGSGTYALPADFFKLRAVEMAPAVDSVGWVPLRRATVDDNRWATDGTPSQAGNSWGYPECYRTFGDGAGDNTLELLPYPSSPLSIRVSYAPVCQTLSSSLQSIDSVNGYDEVVVLRALVYSRAREALPSMDFKEMLAEAEAEMKLSIRKRDRASPRRLRPRLATMGNWRRGPYR